MVSSFKKKKKKNNNSNFNTIYQLTLNVSCFFLYFFILIILLFTQFFFFFFNDTATTEIYTLSLHDALPISRRPTSLPRRRMFFRRCGTTTRRDRKSTRLNSSHGSISYAVFCLKKKKNNQRCRCYPYTNRLPHLLKFLIR